MQIGVSSLPDRVPDPTVTDPGAQTSGAGFQRLIAEAQAEADRRKAISDKSGASADQFTEQGWFAIMKAHGAEIGLGAVTSKITKDSHGELTVIDPVLRAKVINYKNDQLVRSVMAVKRQTDGKAVLNHELGRPPSDGEVRAAEAIGAKDAAKLILTRQSTPNSSAAIAAPDAAKANRALFYRPDGSPQTVNEVIVKLMTPPESTPMPDVARLQAGHAVFAGTPAATTPATPASPMPTQGMTPEMAANLRARAALSSAVAPTTPAQKRPAQRPPLPDLALVGGTIGNLSMPGAARGVTAPTGGKISGWRGQVAGEVTQQLEHPESVVTNAPSKVTIPAPDPRRRAPVDQYARYTPGEAPAAASAPVPAVSTSQLGPQLAPSPAAAQPIPPVAFAQPVSAPQPVQTAAAAPLPALVAGPPQMEPTSALPLLPIDDQPGPLVLSPAGSPPPAPAQAMAPAAPAADPIEMPVAPAARPSRYGPAAASYSTGLPSRTLGYAAASPILQTQAISDASSAGIRPSRYYASTVQQVASMVRPDPHAQQMPVQAQPVIPASYSPQPVTTEAALGPDGMPLLPPVPGRAGLPPITANEALGPAEMQPDQPQQMARTALLEGTKPLDLSPTATAPIAASAAPQPVPLRQRQPRPHLTPPIRN